MLRGHKTLPAISAWLGLARGEPGTGMSAGITERLPHGRHAARPAAPLSAGLRAQVVPDACLARATRVAYAGHTRGRCEPHACQTVNVNVLMKWSMNIVFVFFFIFDPFYMEVGLIFMKQRRWLYVSCLRCVVVLFIGFWWFFGVMLNWVDYIIIIMIIN